MLKIKTRKGVTLIELVVLIGIIGIMSAISIASLTDAKRNSELESSAEELVAVIREVQNYSLSGKLNDTAGVNCGRYHFQTIADTGNYRVFNGDTFATCNIKNVNTLKNGVKFFGALNIFFAAPHGAKAPAGSTIITLTKGSSFYYICVGANGIINKKSSAFIGTNCIN